MMKTYTMTKRSAKYQVYAIIAAVAAAVALPQVCHLLGRWLGFGAAIGETFLPMHLPVMLAGMLAGPVVGLAAGVVSPLLSAWLTAMPAVTLLPFMMIELAVYGLCAGLLRGTKLPSVLQVLGTQIAGRAVRALAILLAVEGFGYTGLRVSIIWTSISAGVVGILLQLILLPLIGRLVRRRF